jgi:cytochrome c oxidase assembly protein subunit 11
MADRIKVGRNPNRRVAMMLASFAAVMLGLGFASVPLYRLFCQTTGFGGTPQRVSEARAREIDATGDAMSVRFDANVERGMRWNFRPEQTTQEITLGGRKMAIFLARNDTDQPITGRASYNIEPEQAAKYFNKVQCFCFTEQTLQPHQEVRMPVIYYVDPKIKDDPDARDVGQITLSYTFHVLKGQSAKGLDQAGTGG